MLQIKTSSSHQNALIMAYLHLNSGQNLRICPTRTWNVFHTCSSKSSFYNNCPISRAPIGSFLSSVRVQTDKIWKLGLARVELWKWATCTRQACLSKTLFIPGIWPVSGLVIVRKQIDISFLCVCPLIEDKFRHNIVKVCCGTTRLRLVAPQSLWQCYDAIYDQ